MSRVVLVDLVDFHMRGSASMLNRWYSINGAVASPIEVVLDSHQPAWVLAVWQICWVGHDLCVGKVAGVSAIAGLSYYGSHSPYSCSPATTISAAIIRANRDRRRRSMGEEGGWWAKIELCWVFGGG